MMAATKKRARSRSEGRETTPVFRMPDSSLPICSYKKQIQAALGSSDSLILTSSTGSGKTTHVPFFIHELMPRRTIAVTQPRRVACTSVAAYTASQVGTGEFFPSRPFNTGTLLNSSLLASPHNNLTRPVCAELGSGVGYNVRFSRRYGPSTKVLYQTDGMLLRECTSSSPISRLFHKYGCVVIDEAHERSVGSDVILSLVRQAQKARNYNRGIKNDDDIEGEGEEVKSMRKVVRKLKIKPLKVVVMSATISTSLFASFFNARVIDVPGRTHRVDVVYLSESVDDYIVACAEAMARLHKTYDEGDILCFLPGADEINE